MNIIFFAVVQRFYGWPCLIKVQENCTRTVCEPYTNCVRTVYKLYANRIQMKTVYSPYGNRTQTVREPYANHKVRMKITTNDKRPSEKMGILGEQCLA